MRSAVLFLIFNRPDTTQVVFEEIRKAKPPRLYVAADGPRDSREGEVEVCRETRSIVDSIDWACDVKTLFRETNLGCRAAVSCAIDWFFENEEEGIVLEDDIVPAPEFFEYCDFMLDRYRDQHKVMMVAGFNPLGAGVESSECFFSQNPTIWGWATWRSRWKLYDVTMSDWSSRAFMQSMKAKLPIYVREYFLDAYRKTKEGLLNTWDYQWTWRIQQGDGLVVKPVANLITNIGVTGTHSGAVDKNHYVPWGKLVVSEIRLPELQEVDHQKDAAWYKYAFDGQKTRLLMRYIFRKLELLAILRWIRKK